MAGFAFITFHCWLNILDSDRLNPWKMMGITPEKPFGGTPLKVRHGPKKYWDGPAHQTTNKHSQSNVSPRSSQVNPTSTQVQGWSRKGMGQGEGPSLGVLQFTAEDQQFHSGGVRKEEPGWGTKRVIFKNRSWKTSAWETNSKGDYSWKKATAWALGDENREGKAGAGRSEDIKPPH